MSKPRHAAGGRAASADRAVPQSRLAPRDRFLSRIAWVAGLASLLVLITLVVGVVGYHFIAGLAWLVAFHEAALLLSGMGPVELNLNDAGRMFESIYALFCGVVLLGATGILFSPVIHRLLHRYHIEDAAADK
jgi:hypothetical protein